MYDPRGLAVTPIEREVHHHVYDVAGIGFDATDVVDVRPLIVGDRVVAFDVIGLDGEITRARNLVVANRPTPILPDGIYRSDRVWHASDVAARLAELPLGQPERFVIVGGERGAAKQLHGHFPDAEICAIENVSRVTDVLESDDHVVVVLGSSGGATASVVRADAIVFATGYEPSDPGRLLGAAAAYCKRDARGDLRIGPDGRVRTTEHVEGAIYVQDVRELGASPLAVVAPQPSH